MSSFNNRNPFDQYRAGTSSTSKSNGNSTYNNNLYDNEGTTDSNNETFLSRIFGLNSIYNQLNENYEYYDPQFDSEYSQQNQVAMSMINQDQHSDDEHMGMIEEEDEEDELLRPQTTTSTNNNITNIDIENNPLTSSFHKNSLLNSDNESVSDLYSSRSASPEPTLAVQKVPDIEVEDNYTNRKVQSPTIPTTNGDVKPVSKKLSFNISKPNNLFRFNNNKAELPLYNEYTPNIKPPPTRTQQQFRKPAKNEPQTEISNNYQRSSTASPRFIIPPKERALWLWANIINMDDFLNDMYYYYRGKGLLNIVLSKLVDLAILVFILFFTVFLKWGIRYSYFFSHFNDRLPHLTLGDLIIENFFWSNVPFIIKFFLLGFTGYIILRLVQLYFDYKNKLKGIQTFYKYLINIKNDDELMTISWKTIVERLMLLKDYNSLTSTSNNNMNGSQHFINDLNSKVRLNAHDIANRIMRKENYMIALINKDVLDLSVDFKVFGYQLITNKSVLTKTLEWNLKLCINDFIFNNEGQVNSKILKDSNRNQLAKELTSRIKRAAIINVILCPFMVIYFVLLYFFRYFNEYKSNPSSIVGLREYTPYAEWKLREFNELSHFFNRRLQLSMGPANTYINQFPRGFLIINVLNLINFISGSILAVLVIMGLLLEDDNRSFWTFEITEGKSALFYISLFGTLFAITSTSNNQSNNNSTNELNTFVYDPEASLRYVSQFTHYLPTSWRKRLHTIEVKNEFCDLFSLKIVIILNEILSVILTPFLLWFKVSNSSGAIIDFFREYSVHVDGLGYVCSFAMFNFEEKDKNMMVDLNNKKKVHRARRRKIAKTSTKKSPITSTGGEVELNNIIKSKKKVKGSPNSDYENDTFDETDDEDDYNDMNVDYNQNEKMFKSYMYFLESYGGANPNASGKSGSNQTVNGSAMPPNVHSQAQPIPTNNRSHNIANNNNNINVNVNSNNPTNRSIMNQSINEPSPSMLIQSTMSTQTGLSGHGDHSLAEFYNVNYKFDEEENAKESKNDRGGFLGIINQVYKQDFDR
ncbi:autophagy-related protein 9 [Scheffersomyces amazonensis]|uniref:autophagy-related protein 9 n=1 Tax=Scheffersomyces amazonensis TaxID=1078765 RepID=UPI00315C5DE9